MTKLKTLKDLGIHNCEFCDSVTYRREDIRKEAIKWVKAWRKHHQDFGQREETVSWIKNFFNITEEDLSKSKTSKENEHT